MPRLLGQNSAYFLCVCAVLISFSISAFASTSYAQPALINGWRSESLQTYASDSAWASGRQEESPFESEVIDNDDPR